MMSALHWGFYGQAELGLPGAAASGDETILFGELKNGL